MHRETNGTFWLASQSVMLIVVTKGRYENTRVVRNEGMRLFNDYDMGVEIRAVTFDVYACKTWFVNEQRECKRAFSLDLGFGGNWKWKEGGRFTLTLTSG